MFSRLFLLLTVVPGCLSRPEPPVSTFSDSTPDGDSGGEAARCGDGTIDPGEGCDDGDANGDGAPCTSACVPARCGDGLLLIGVEGCDDGNTFGGDGCGPSCRTPVDGSLADADAIFLGAAANDRVGEGLAVQFTTGALGDQILVGAYRVDVGGVNAGAVYQLSGSTRGTTVLGLESAWFGVQDDSSFGSSLAALDDLDGDGLGDFAVGAPGSSGPAGATAGAAYFVMSAASSTVETMPRLDGEAAGDSAASPIVNGGALDGPGSMFLLVGSDGQDGGGVDAGAVYLVAAAVPLAESDLAQAHAILLGDTPGAQAGEIPSGTGDLNGDGDDDVAVGSPLFGSPGIQGTHGVVDVVFGPVSPGTHSLADADLRAVGEAAGDFAHVTARVGDLSGDGTADLGASAYAHDSDGGAVYVAAGGPAIALDNLADAEIIFRGSPGDLVGFSLDSAGDVNGDGASDVVIGAPGLGGAGGVYLVLGPLPVGTWDLEQADVVLRGVTAADAAGTAVAGDGDVDGDGLADLLVSAPGNDNASGTDAGAAYLLLGSTLQALVSPP